MKLEKISEWKSHWPDSDREAEGGWRSWAAKRRGMSSGLTAGAVGCAWPLYPGRVCRLTEHCPVLRTCSSTRARWDVPEQAPLSPLKPSGTGTMANRRRPCPSPLPPPPHSLERIYCWEESLGSRKVQEKKRPSEALQLLSLQKAAHKLFYIQCWGAYRKHSYFSA